MLNPRKALVVLSGGQDSTTCLFWAKHYYQEVVALTFDYNQRHSLEIQAARNIAKLAGVEHEVVSVGPILAGTSPLTDPNAPLEKYEDYASMDKTIGDRVELTFVPMRNALFLTLAANRAIVGDAATVVTGVCQADNANYPDCRQHFIDSQQYTINAALGLEKGPTALYLATPLMTMSKAESINLAVALGCYAHLAFTHTSYDGKYPPTDNNHANVLRAQGFLEANLPDPLVIRAWREGLMEMPTTPNYVDLDHTGLLKQIQSLKDRL